MHSEATKLVWSGLVTQWDESGRDTPYLGFTPENDDETKAFNDLSALGYLRQNGRSWFLTPFGVGEASRLIGS